VVALATLGLLAVLLVSGCGQPGNPLARVTEAASRTLAGTAGFDLTLNGWSAFGVPRGQLVGRGVSDFRAALTYEALDVNEVAHLPAYTMYFVFLGKTVLLQPSPAPAGLLPAGKFWISVEPSRPAELTPTNPNLAAQLQGLTPSLALHELRWGTERASPSGQQVVDHVPLAEYRVQIDLAKSLAAARAAGNTALVAAIAEQILALRARSPNAHDTRLEMQVWIDGPGYVAQLETRVPGSGLGTAFFSLSGFSQRVARSIPAAAAVVPFDALRRSGRAVPSPWLLARG
jgi:hypothetical protein